MFKNSFTRYYKKTKASKKQVSKKRLVKGIKIFQKKRKTKSNNMVTNDVTNLTENEKQKLARA